MPKSRETNQAIRAWAREEGFEVSRTGQLSSEVIAAWEERDLDEVVPTPSHRQAARRILNASRQQGATGVLRVVNDLQYDDLPLVVVALARRMWDGSVSNT